MSPRTSKNVLSLFVSEQTCSAGRQWAHAERSARLQRTRKGEGCAGLPRGVRQKSQRPTWCQTQKPPLSTGEVLSRRPRLASGIGTSRVAQGLMPRAPHRCPARDPQNHDDPGKLEIGNATSYGELRRSLLYTPGELDHLQQPKISTLPASLTAAHDASARGRLLFLRLAG